MQIVAMTFLFCSAAVGMGVYGNEDAKNGVQEFTAATKAGVSIVVSVRQEVGIQLTH